MSNINITLPDGSVKIFEKGVAACEITGSISQGLLRNALAVEADGNLHDLSHNFDSDVKLFKVLTFNDIEGQNVLRHSASHILAQAVKRLYPNCKLAIGPHIKDGFYYDIDFNGEFTEGDLSKIEAEMEKIIKENLPVERVEISQKDAIELFAKQGETYKVELIEGLTDGSVTLYRQGEFCDLCRGPHVPSTGRVKCVKLTSIAGAYWRGDVKNKMLTRIYGTAFEKNADLVSYLERIEEAKRRDHRKLGRELELYDIYEEGPGFPFFFPKGMLLFNNLIEFWRQEHTRAGYQEVKTPIILSQDLWHRSGHWDHYKDNMYVVKVDDADFAVKPMNCPGGMLVYKSKLHSYRDLPLRIAELGLVHRHELSGALHGLMRVRCFTQDDAHIFMTMEQIENEIKNVVNLIDSFYSVFGFKYKLELSTRPENSMGSDEQWNAATAALKNALDALGKTYEINEGDGAFYGPKIDFHLEDCLGRTWQCGTIQLDFQMPERFELTYVGDDGQKHPPVMIHRVVFGSIERFIAILTEHFAGAFPLWLSPVQVKVLPISESVAEYANGIFAKLQKHFRVELDDRNEKIGYRIREAQMQKIPYMLVAGAKEAESGLVSVRHRKDGDIGTMAVEDFITLCNKQITEKSI